MKNAMIHRVASLCPGQAIDIDQLELDMAVPGFECNDAVFTSADRVLENIIGSAYEFGYHVNASLYSVTFYRLKQPLTDESRTYTSPDRR